MDTLLAPVLDAVNRGASPDDVYELLAEAYPQMDDTALREVLARALFVADVWGRLNA
ncbi:hypothetical protein [Laribacter hongkongensis]